MPCDSSYMAANTLEIELSKTLCLLEEISSGKPVDIKSSAWRGYHKNAYGNGNLRERADKAVSTLCHKLRNTDDVTKYSLEMQIWWRDHQKADKERSG